MSRPKNLVGPQAELGQQRTGVLRIDPGMRTPPVKEALLAELARRWWRLRASS